MPTDEQLHKRIEELEKEVNWLKMCVETLLDFMPIVQGKLFPPPENVEGFPMDWWKRFNDKGLS